jgi:hypothetical protein
MVMSYEMPNAKWQMTRVADADADAVLKLQFAFS